MGDPRAASAKPRWNDLGRRVVSALILAPIVLMCIWFGSAPFTVLMLAASLGLSVEWVALCGKAVTRPAGMALLAATLGGTLLAGFGQPGIGLVVIAVGAFLLWRPGGRAALAGGAFYIGVPAVALVWLRGGSSGDGFANLLFLVLVIWASDIGAYLSGRLLGGPKLAPALSPGKTWAGAAGALIAAMLVAQATAWAFGAPGHGRAALLGSVLGVACQAGDLLESGLKRHFGVKDSGRLIPGHGGLLDRLDGLLAAAPVAALAVMMGRGGFLWH